MPTAGGSKQIMTNLNAIPISKSFALPPSGRKLSNCLGGLRPGPALLVATGPDLFDPLHRRLSALPSLPWMRGSLTLVRLSDVDDNLPAQDFDDVLTLLQADCEPDTVNAVYWTVLRKATALGMIEGRGVPASPDT